MATATKRKVGRPPIELDPEKGQIFGYFRATYQTMAEQIDCSTDTIQRAMSDPDSKFAAAYKKGFSTMKMKLSEAQVKAAVEEHNATLLVWLGKQYLGQRDVPDIDGEKLNIEITMRPKRLAETDED